jgi:predicted PurR-regulated permease PerM
MPKIDNNSTANANLAMEQQRANETPNRGEKFGKVLSGVATVALKTTATVAPIVPGGVIVGKAAEGVQKLRESRPGGLGDGPQDQIDKMWAMQQENQVFNMQYMQLQQSIQADNRNFSTMSNLLKVRHDTAKSAINNMHA